MELGIWDSYGWEAGFNPYSFMKTKQTLSRFCQSSKALMLPNLLLQPGRVQIIQKPVSKENVLLPIPPR